MKSRCVTEIKRSLSSYFSKCTKIMLGNILIALLIILIWTIPQDNGTTYLTITTSTSIDELDQQIYLATMTSITIISYYWQAEAYMNAVSVAVSSLIWPFMVLLAIFFIWVKSLYPSTRTKFLLFVVLTSKITLLTCYTEAVLTYSTFLDVQYQDLIDIKTTSTPVAVFGIFMAVSLTAIVIADILFVWDQLYCHIYDEDAKDNNNIDIDDGAYAGSIQSKSNKIGRGNMDSKWYKFELKTLAFTYKPQSYLGILMHSLFLTIIVINTWVLIESWFTVAVRVDVMGVLSLILSDANRIRSKSLYEIPGALMDSVGRNAVTTVLAGCYFGATIVSSMVFQFVILCVWFLPIRQFKYFNVLIILGFIVHSLNGYEMYFISIILTGQEIDLFTKYLVDNLELPKLCGIESFVSQNIGSCFYNTGSYNITGVVLTGVVIIVHWFSLFYTAFIASKTGIRAIRFRGCD